MGHEKGAACSLSRETWEDREEESWRESCPRRRDTDGRFALAVSGGKRPGQSNSSKTGRPLLNSKKEVEEGGNYLHNPGEKDSVGGGGRLGSPLNI